MRLNLHILKEDLCDLVHFSHLVSDVQSRNASAARPYLSGETLVEGAFYIADAEALPARPQFKGAPDLISVGEPPKAYLDAGINLLVVDSAVSHDELFVRIADLFMRYDEWECQLRDFVISGAEASDLGRISQPIFENPLYCQGPGFKVLFLYPGDMDHATDDQREHMNLIFGGTFSFEPDSPLPEDAVSRLHSIRRYAEAMKDKGLVFYDNENTGTKAWCYNIGPAGAHIGRVMIYEIHRALTNRDASLLCVFAHYLEQVLRKLTTDSSMETSRMTVCVDNMLAHKLMPERQITEALESEGWELADEYFCLVLEIGVKDTSWLGLQTIALGLDESLPENNHLVFDHKLVYIFNLTKIELSDEEALRKVTPVFRDAMLHAGASEPFTNFKGLYYYHIQAQEALAFGTHKDPSFWCYRYRDYAFDILIDRCQDERPLETLMPRGLRSLQAHDDKYGTELVSLLKVYLENNLSVTATARASFSSRSTCIRHLQRIKEISNLDLEESRVRFELSVVFAIAENGKMITVD